MIKNFDEKKSCKNYGFFYFLQRIPYKPRCIEEPCYGRSACDMLFLFVGNDILDENHSWPEKMELEDMVKAISNMKDDERKTKKIFLYELV